MVLVSPLKLFGKKVRLSFGRRGGFSFRFGGVSLKNYGKMGLGEDLRSIFQQYAYIYTYIYRYVYIIYKLYDILNILYIYIYILFPEDIDNMNNMYTYNKHMLFQCQSCIHSNLTASMISNKPATLRDF